MQMSKTYETTNRRVRAAQKRQDALECDKAGFPMLARVNWEEASLLDPPRDEEDMER
jgi:hypothetical protein